MLRIKQEGERGGPVDADFHLRDVAHFALVGDSADWPLDGIKDGKTDPRNRRLPSWMNNI